MKQISHVVNRFKKGNGLVVEGIYEMGTFSQKNFDAVYGVGGFILNEVKEPTFGERRFDPEDGEVFYIVKTLKEIESEAKAKEEAEAKAKAKEESEAKAKAERIEKEDKRKSFLLSNYKNLTQISDEDLDYIWAKLEFKSYNNPEKPFVNDWVVMFETVSIYGHIVPVGENTLFANDIDSEVESQNYELPSETETKPIDLMIKEILEKGGEVIEIKDEVFEKNLVYYKRDGKNYCHSLSYYESPFFRGLFRR